MEQFVYVCRKCHFAIHSLYPMSACRYCHEKRALELIEKFDATNEAQRLDIETRLAEKLSRQA